MALALMVAAVVAVLAASHTALTVVEWAGVDVAVRVPTAGPATETPARKGTPLREEFLVAITVPEVLPIFTAVVPSARGPVPPRLGTLGSSTWRPKRAYVPLGAGVRRADLATRAKARPDNGTAAVLFGTAGLLETSRT